eukprot:3039302-Amphidinium_carterae.1
MVALQRQRTKHQGTQLGPHVRPILTANQNILVKARQLDLRHWQLCRTKSEHDAVQQLRRTLWGSLAYRFAPRRHANQRRLGGSIIYAVQDPSLAQKGTPSVVTRYCCKGLCL